MPSRNQEAYFSELPKIDIQRSIFNRPFNHKTSFNIGDVIPFYLDEIIPGSTHNVTTSIVARLQTLLTPIMDNIYLDTYYFFVPMRLVWSHTKNFFGENDNGPWTRDKVNYQIPYLNYPQPESGSEPGTTFKAGFSQGSIADYLGIPINAAVSDSADSKDKPSALPFRAYALVMSEFFRDQNLQQPIVVHTDDTIRRGVHPSPEILNQDGTWSEPYVTELELGGAPFKAARFHDYFSSCLPAPQRSEAISIFGAPLGSDSNHIPVNAFEEVHSLGEAPLRGHMTKTNTSPASTDVIGRLWYNGSSNPYNGTFDAGTGSGGFYPSNLYADFNIPEATITQLRLAFQLQRFYERAATSGNRYREYLSGFFGTSNGDARMQVPEYLGGHRIPLVIHQVANTSQSADGDLGDVGAMSNTADVHEDFHMSFSEHGYLLGVMVARYDNSYTQGLSALWSRRDPLDFYNPVFAHISEQPIFKREIAFSGLPDNDGYVDADAINEVFGYNQAWSSYRYMVDRCSGEMRPEASNSLSSWHLADDYDAIPNLGSKWIQTNKDIVDRVLAVGSDVANQLFADIHVDNEAVLPMPVHSIPGLADHF